MLPFESKSDVVVLSAYNSDGTYIAERRGTLSSGVRRKARYSIEIRSEPLLHIFDEFMLGAGPADAIKTLVQDQIRGITEEVSDSTLAFRKRAQIAYEQGKPWAKKRYAGGRLGAMPPAQGARFKFNDSGRFLRGVTVMQNLTDKTFTINVAANRLNPEQFGAGYAKMTADLVRLVPALDPAKLGQYKVVENAIRASIGDMIQRAENWQAVLLKQLAAARKQALIAAGRAVFGGITSPVR